MGTKKKMKIIKYIVAFTLSAVVSLTSINRAVSKTSVSRDLAEETRPGARGNSSRKRKARAERRARYAEARKRNEEAREARKDKGVFESNTISACKNFDNGNLWNRNWAYFTCVNSYQEEKKGITLNMNDFVGNPNGKLVKGSGYWNSCDDTSITKAGVLHATCEDKNGKDVKTSIDIKTLLVWKGDFLSRK